MFDGHEELAQLLFLRSARGDVFLDCYIISDRAVRLAQRDDDRRFDLEGAVTAAVDELAAPGVAGQQCFCHCCVDAFRGFPGFEDARILADDLVTGITGVEYEGIIDVLNARFQIRDNHRVRALLNSQ